MAETLADIRKLAQSQEAELLVEMTALAKLIAPPITPKLRERINNRRAAAQHAYFKLNTLWYRHLHLPETRNLPHFSAEMAYFGSLRRRLNFLTELQSLLTQVLRA